MFPQFEGTCEYNDNSLRGQTAGRGGAKQKHEVIVKLGSFARRLSSA